MPQHFYITTPIYYVNDNPHIGHMYTTVLADVIARYRRMSGENVYFLTGTDEHGQKIEKTAASLGINPKALADKVMLNFYNIWQQMEITNDHFVRTTDLEHKLIVQNLFEKLMYKKDIYKSTYKGLYSISDEAYVTEIQAAEMKAQGLANQLTELQEESYFFRLSSYESWLIQLYKQNKEFIQPSFRLNEVKQFVSPNNIRGNLQDLSISRTSISWGIQVPKDESHVIYVWFDALLNYFSASRKDFWPPSIQIVGKDILRFHAVYWPAFIMAIFRQPEDDLNGALPKRILEQLPKTILTHGWWLMGNNKVSKSKGNIVRPEEILKFGNDAVRFFFIREMQIGLDRNFSMEGMIDCLNADLANCLGNLISRTLSMLKRYCNGKVPVAEIIDICDQKILQKGRELVPGYLKKANENDFYGAITFLWNYLRELDSYIVQSEPWKLAKDDINRPKLNTVLCQLYRALRATALLISPVMPDLAQKLWISLGFTDKVSDQKFDNFIYEAPTDITISNNLTLFQRINKEDIMQENLGIIAATSKSSIEDSLTKNTPAIKNTIDYELFSNIDLRVGQIITAERVPKSKKLIKMNINIGSEVRIILGGIGTTYTPEDLINLKVVVIANLSPRSIMGIKSHGMILAASDKDSKPQLITPPANTEPGFVIQ